MIRRSAAALTLATAVLLVLPSASSAHGIMPKADLPIPAWMFAWAASLVLIVSFGALAVLWRRPVLAATTVRPLFRVGAWADLLLGAWGVAAFALVCWAGLAGTTVATANLAPTAVWVAFWVGMPVLSALFGDLFRLLSPWRAVGRAVGWAATRIVGERLPDPNPWPKRAGRLPAAVSLVLMTWLELAAMFRDEPSTLAILALAYAAVQLVGMAMWGVEQWCSNGDGFGVAFSLIAGISPLERAGGRLRLRAPIAELARRRPWAGTQAVLLVLIGATTFDGFTQGPLWADWSIWLSQRFRDLGFGLTAAAEAAATVGLIGGFAAVTVIWLAGVDGTSRILEMGVREIGGRFAQVLVPIALAYAVAHYASLLLTQGQALGFLISDPAGSGADWFGTVDLTVDYGVVGPTAIWWIQVVALVVGHLAALVLAHDRALELAPDARIATRSQVPMLIATVAFTTLGLWLLSAANL